MFAIMPLLLGITRAGADIGIMGVLFLGNCVVRKDWGWVKTPEVKALLGLWVFMMAVSVASPVSKMGAFTAALIWGRFVLFYFAARFWILLPSPALKKLHVVGLGILGLAAIDTFWQYKTGVSLTGHHMVGEDRLTGPLTKANIGNFFVKVGFPMVGLWSYSLVAGRQARRLWMAGLALLVMIAIVMISGERSTPLLMLLSFGVVGLTVMICQPKSRKYVIGAGVVIAAFLGLVAATQPIVMGKVQLFIEQVSDFWNTPYGQLYIAAGRLFREHPLTGIGAQQFLEACKPEILNVTYCDVHPHNMYMEWLEATGAPGICLFVLSMILVVTRFIKGAVFSGNASILTAVGLSAFAVVIFPFVVTQSVFSNWSAALFWYSLALGMSAMNFGKDAHERG